MSDHIFHEILTVHGSKDNPNDQYVMIHWKDINPIVGMLNSYIDTMPAPYRDEARDINTKLFKAYMTLLAFDEVGRG